MKLDKTTVVFYLCVAILFCEIFGIVPIHESFVFAAALIGGLIFLVTEILS